MSGDDGKGNGVDQAAVYGAIMALSAELRAFRAEVGIRFAQTASDIAALRAEVAAYHGSVVGHGVLISEHEDRIGRLERGEPPKAA